MSQLDTFSTLYNHYKDRFIRIAKTYVVDIMVAEDIVMDSFIYFWEHQSRLAEDTNPPAYIMTTIKHKCMNYLKQQKTRKSVEGIIKTNMEWKLDLKIATLEACNPEELFTSEVEGIINETLSKLPLKTREIFLMSRMENKSYREIAAYYNLTTRGVEFHIRKALHALRLNLKDYLSVFIFLFLN